VRPKIMPNWVSNPDSFQSRTITFQNMLRGVSERIALHIPEANQERLVGAVGAYLATLAKEHSYMPLKCNIGQTYLQWEGKWFPVEFVGAATPYNKAKKPTRDGVLLARLMSQMLRKFSSDESAVRRAKTDAIKLLEDEYDLAIAPAEVHGKVSEDPKHKGCLTGSFVWQQYLHSFTVNLRAAGGLRQLW